VVFFRSFKKGSKTGADPDAAKLSDDPTNPFWSDGLFEEKVG
jgi:hypothetical protein